MAKKFTPISDTQFKRSKATVEGRQSPTQEFSLQKTITSLIANNDGQGLQKVDAIPFREYGSLAKTLGRGLESRDLQVRGWCADRLSEFGPYAAAAKTYLLKALSDDDPRGDESRFQDAVRAALACLGTLEVNELLQVLGEGNVRVVGQLLAKLKAESLLVELLDGEPTSLPYQAALAALPFLETIGAELIECLQRNLKLALANQFSAKKLILAVGGLKENGAAFGEALAILARNSDRELSSCAVNALARTSSGGSRLMDLLRELDSRQASADLEVIADAILSRLVKNLEGRMEESGDLNTWKDISDWIVARGTSNLQRELYHVLPYAPLSNTESLRIIERMPQRIREEPDTSAVAAWLKVRTEEGKPGERLLEIPKSALAHLFDDKVLRELELSQGSCFVRASCRHAFVDKERGCLEFLLEGSGNPIARTTSSKNVYLEPELFLTDRQKGAHLIPYSESAQQCKHAFASNVLLSSMRTELDSRAVVPVGRGGKDSLVHLHYQVGEIAIAADSAGRLLYIKLAGLRADSDRGGLEGLLPPLILECSMEHLFSKIFPLAYFSIEQLREDEPLGNQALFGAKR